MMFQKRSEDKELSREASFFTRYLLDNEPTPEIVDRYINANRKLGTDIISSSDSNVLGFAMNHPWAIPFLDAAASLVQKEELLRKKIYIMAAVLEASPTFTRDFLAENHSLYALIWKIVSNGFSSAMKVIVGIPLFIIIRKRSDA